jgi:phenylalanyl-tRNA synthetase beta subunit
LRSDILKKIELFDEYRDIKKLGKGLKNLTFHLEFQAKDKTLEDSEIDANFENVVQALDKTFGAKLRLEFDQKKK